MHILHNPQLQQLSALQHLIKSLNTRSVLSCFTSFGRVIHSLVSRKGVDSIPKVFVRTKEFEIEPVWCEGITKLRDFQLPCISNFIPPFPYYSTPNRVSLFSSFIENQF